MQDVIMTSDLPPPDQPFTPDAFRHRWPSGADSAELIDGVLWFRGVFDHRDAETACRTYPGRRVTLGPDGSLLVGTDSDIDRLLANSWTSSATCARRRR
jgi:hypothetical protein